MSNPPESLRQLARTTRAAQRRLAAADASTRTATLREVAALLRARTQSLLEANRQDCDAAKADGTSPALLARLRLDEKKLATLCDGLETLAASTDPIGRPLRRTLLDDKLELTQVASPLGVLLVIFESRPDAVIQIGGLAIRSGNAVILKGGREASRSNAALVSCLRDALSSQGLSPQSVQGIEGREAVSHLLELDQDIDLVIPRGSGELVRAIQSSTRIPVLGHAEGICMTYLDRAADARIAEHVVIDGKCDYPAACNATETLLVHQAWLDQLGPIVAALIAQGVEVRADERAMPYAPGATAASEQDGSVEYGALTIAVRTVSSIDEAIEYINDHGSGHTDSIVTSDDDGAARFLREVDSASVFHNASTRFADGYRYGLGAEVGISTSRIHARGPVGVDGLMTTRWLLRGAGQGAADYGPGKRSFIHKRLSTDEG